MERLKGGVERTMGFLREKASGIPRDVHQMMIEVDRLENGLGMDPWDSVREQLRKRKGQLEQSSAGDKPVNR